MLFAGIEGVCEIIRIPIIMKQFLILIIQLIKRPWLILKHNRIPLSTRVMENAILIHCNIGKYCYIGCGGIYDFVHTGNYCSFAPNVLIGGMEHSFWAVSTSTHLSDQCVFGRVTTIGNDVWVGANSVIRQGVRIGDGAVIGAGSVVTKDVQENTIVCGAPAKFLKKRFDDETWRQIKASNYWALDKKRANETISHLRKSV